jgi:hypothetical protein
MSIRYKVLDLPVNGTGAFTPIPFRNPIASSWGLVVESGSPGTTPIPRPKAAAIPPISAIRETQSTYVSPDVGLPDIYIAYANNMGPSQHVNMAGRRLTPIPVPAVSWVNTALVSFQTSKVGGRLAQAWPRAFQRWPTIGNPTGS